MKLVFEKDKVKWTQKVQTPFGDDFIEKELTYSDISGDRINIEMTSVSPELKEEGLVGIAFEVSSFEKVNKNTTKLEKELNHSEAKYKVITVREKFRNMFPYLREPFKLETNVGEIETYINNGGNIAKGLSKWFRENKVNEGDRIVIEPLDSENKHYKLYKE